MVLAELVTYLAAQSLGLTAGTNLFYSLMPDAPDACTCLYEYPGFPPEPELGGTTIRIQFPSIMVIVRGADSRTDDYDDPRALAGSIYNSLVKIGDQQLSGIQYLAIEPKQDPYFLRRDENFRVYIACNYHITKNPS